MWLGQKCKLPPNLVCVSDRSYLSRCSGSDFLRLQENINNTCTKDCQENAKTSMSKTFTKVPGKQPTYHKNISCWNDEEEGEREE